MQELGTITPTLEEFREYAATRRVVPVRMSALVTGDGAARPGTFLLESAAEGGVWSRYSFVGAGSVATLTARDGQAHWLGDAPSGAPTDGDPLEALRATMELLHTEPFEGVPPLTSGMVGFVGWEAVRRWEKLPHPPEDDLHVPELAMNLVSDMAVHDSKDGTVLLVANAVNVNGTDENVDAAYHDAVASRRRAARTPWTCTAPCAGSTRARTCTSTRSRTPTAGPTRSWAPRRRPSSRSRGARP